VNASSRRASGSTPASAAASRGIVAATSSIASAFLNAFEASVK